MKQLSPGTMTKAVVGYWKNEIWTTHGLVRQTCRQGRNQDFAKGGLKMQKSCDAILMT